MNQKSKNENTNFNIMIPLFIKFQRFRSSQKI